MKNDTTISAFYPLVRVGLWGKVGANLNHNLDEGVDWNVVYSLAQEQSVQGLVLQGFELLKKRSNNLGIPQVLLLQWIGEVQMIEKENEELNAFVADLIEKLRKEQIATLLVKGQGVAQCYEKPLLRTCGDVDLFLSEEDYDKAKTFLLPKASKVETEYESSKHLGMTIDGWTVELHGNLRGSLSRRINREMESVQDDTFNRNDVRVWDNGGIPIYLLGKENDIVYVFVHFLNHFYKEGVGLRQICDWCRLLWTFRDEIDKKKIEGRIRRMGLVSEWKAFGAYAVEYLGMPIEAMPHLNANDDINARSAMPLGLSKNLKKKADRIMKFVMKTGNMGHNRDMSHFSNKPYLSRKCISMGRRIGDLINHARIFPLDSLRFFPNIMWSGMRSAIRGE